MRPIVLLRIVAAVMTWFSASAFAETLQCNGSSVAEGDSRLSVVYKCGQPLLTDTFCAPVYQGSSPYPLPGPLASALVPCQPIDEWLYDRGPGNLMAKVRFRSGVVMSIIYSQAPR